MQRFFIPQTTRLAATRNIEIRSYLKAERRRWTEAFRVLASWANLRNEATSHYGGLKTQVGLLQLVERDKVVKVAHAFLHYNDAILRALATVGGNSVHGIGFSEFKDE